MIMKDDYDGYAADDSDDKVYNVIIIVSSFLYISTLTCHHFDIPLHLHHYHHLHRHHLHHYHHDNE